MKRATSTLLALGLAGTFSLAALPAGATSKPTTTSILGAAKKAIAKETGVHVVVDATGNATNKVVADLGTKVGTESVTSGTATATIKVTTSAAYIGGNASGLTSLIGLTAAEVKKVGKLWISVKAGTSQYTSLQSENTISTVSGILPAVKGTTLSTEDASKKNPLYVLKWTVAATSSAPKLNNTVKIQAKGATLPVEVDQVDTSGGGATKFSKWGEQVKVSAPPAGSTIDISKVITS